MLEGQRNARTSKRDLSAQADRLKKERLFNKLSPLPEWWVKGRPETWTLERPVGPLPPKRRVVSPASKARKIARGEASDKVAT